ncbi:MAG: type II secretion system F family protein [Terracidiphilus sp.]|jgi:tight adherence protein B
MGVIAVAVFIGVFVLIALPLVASASSNNSKQALAQLDMALKSEPRQVVRQQNMDLRKDDQLSSIPWLNKKLVNVQLAPYLRKMLSQAELDWSPGRLLIMSAAGFALSSYFVFMYFQSFLPALAAGVVLGALPFGWVFFKRSRRFSAFEKYLPEALDLMVSGLRAGHSLLAAMALVSRECPEPLKSEFKICFEEQNYGLEMKTALENLLERIPLQDLKITASAILIQKESGGNLAEVLDKTSHVIRERFRLKRQIMVHTAQGRLTGLVLTCLPIVLGIGIYFVDPGMISILWHRQIGIEMMWGAAGLILLGGIVIYKIVNIDV